MRIGFFSCQDWGSGYYTAHAGLAREDCDADRVPRRLHRTRPTPNGNVEGRADHTSTAESGECELLDEYRAKYRLLPNRYRPARDARAAPRSWRRGTTTRSRTTTRASTRARRATSGPSAGFPFAERKANGYRSFFEQMPVVAPGRRSATGSTGASRLGGLADVFVLDERQYRSDQTCGDVPGIPCPPPPPGHTLLGRPQMDWFKWIGCRGRAPTGR